MKMEEQHLCLHKEMHSTWSSLIVKKIFERDLRKSSAHPVVQGKITNTHLIPGGCSSILLLDSFSDKDCPVVQNPTVPLARLFSQKLCVGHEGESQRTR